MSDACIVAGELDDEQAVVLAQMPHVGISFASLRIRNPAAFAEMLRRKWQRQEFDDPVTLEPVYLSRDA